MLAVDHGQIVGVPLGGLRPPRPGPVGVVVVVGQRRQELADDLRMRRRLMARLPTTKLTVVAVLPPKLSVPNVFAPSTW